MKLKLGILFLILCMITGCGNMREAENSSTDADPETTTYQMGLPSGMIQQTQLFFNNHLYKLYIVDELYELPDGFEEAGTVMTITPYDIPAEEEVGAGPDVYVGQKIYSCPEYNSAILLQIGDRYITLSLDQLDMVSINELEVQGVRTVLALVESGSLMNAAEYDWSAEEMAETLHAATEELTTEMQYAWIEQDVALEIQTDSDEYTLTLFYGKTENVVYIQLRTAEQYLYRAICTNPELYRILHK